MMMTAAEIKNKFIYTLRWFSVDEINDYWVKFVAESHCTDDYEFIHYLRKNIRERIDG